MSMIKDLQLIALTIHKILRQNYLKSDILLLVLCRVISLKVE